MTNTTTTDYPRTIGMDLGASNSSYCIVDPSGGQVREGDVRTSRDQMRPFFESEPRGPSQMTIDPAYRWNRCSQSAVQAVAHCPSG